MKKYRNSRQPVWTTEKRIALAVMSYLADEHALSDFALNEDCTNWFVTLIDQVGDVIHKRLLDSGGRGRNIDEMLDFSQYGEFYAKHRENKAKIV